MNEQDFDIAVRRLSRVYNIYWRISYGSFDWMFSCGMKALFSLVFLETIYFYEIGDDTRAEIYKKMLKQAELYFVEKQSMVHRKSIYKFLRRRELGEKKF